MPAARVSLMLALTAEPRAAARIFGDAWATLGSEERARVANVTVKWSFDVADLLERIGAEGWAMAPPAAQALLLQSAGSHDGAAARALLIFSDALDDDDWMSLLHTTAPGECGTLAVARALADGYSWLNRMAFFLPEETDDADVHAARLAVIHRAPPQVAARLPRRRP